MTLTPVQVLTTTAWGLALAGILFTEQQVLRVFSVLLMGGILIAQIWRGPMKPSLLIAPQNVRVLGDTFFLYLPVDYVRVGEPIPTSAIVLWWVLTILFPIFTAGFTFLVLTGRFLN